MTNKLTTHDYRILFAKWKQDFGVEARGRRTGNVFMAVPTNPYERVQMYIVLIDTLVERNGYTKSDFDSIFMKELINTSVPPEYDDKKALTKWKNHAEDDFIKALAICLEDDMIVKERSQKEIRKKVFVDLKPEPTPQPPGEDVDPHKMSKMTGIAVPTDTDDEEFLKLLEGPSNE